MQFQRAYGVRFFAFHVRHSIDVILRTMHDPVGAPCLIALLRAAAGATTIATLAVIARVMWAALPATADAIIAGIGAIAWTLWLDQQEAQ